MMDKDLIQPEDFKDRIIFMSMFNDIDWSQKENDEKCISNSEKVKTYAKRFSQGHWSFLGHGSADKWNATLAYKPDGLWEKVAEEMMIFFAESGRIVFRGTSRGRLKSKCGGKPSIHHNGGTYTCRVTAHHCLRQPAQYLRSHRGLVPGSCSTDQRSFSTLHGTRVANVDNNPASQVPSGDV